MRNGRAPADNRPFVFRFRATCTPRQVPSGGPMLRATGGSSSNPQSPPVRDHGRRQNARRSCRQTGPCAGRPLDGGHLPSAVRASGYQRPPRTAFRRQPRLKFNQPATSENRAFLRVRFTHIDFRRADHTLARFGRRDRPFQRRLISGSVQGQGHTLIFPC